MHVEGYMQQLASGKGSEYDREVDIVRICLISRMTAECLITDHSCR